MMLDLPQPLPTTNQPFSVGVLRRFECTCDREGFSMNTFKMHLLGWNRKHNNFKYVNSPLENGLP